MLGVDVAQVIRGLAERGVALPPPAAVQAAARPAQAPPRARRPTEPGAG